MNRAGPGEFSVFISFTRELCESLYTSCAINLSLSYIMLTAPSIAPQNLSISRISPTVMVVSWTPLSYVEARGFISHYTVAYSPQTSDGRKRQDNGQIITVPGMNSSITRIVGLDPDTVYTVQVSATTGGGTSTVGVGTAMTIPTSNAGGGNECNNGAVIGIAVSALIVISTLIIVIIILLVKRYKKYVMYNL